MTITLRLTRDEEGAWKQEAERLGLTLEGMIRQAVWEKINVRLKGRPIPQSLDEIKPRRVPPPGMTAMQMVYQRLPADETDEELQAALREMG